MNLKILLLPGDGIGTEVTAAAVQVLQAVTLFTEEMGYSKDEQEWILGRGLAECLAWPIK